MGEWRLGVDRAFMRVRSFAGKVRDRYVRKLAEMENLRTRTAQEVLQAKDFATQRFCKDLLEVTALSIIVSILSSIALPTISTCAVFLFFV